MKKDEGTSEFLGVSDVPREEKVEETGSHGALVDRLVDHQKAIEVSLGEAIAEAAKAGRWDVVEMLAKVLGERK